MYAIFLATTLLAMSFFLNDEKYKKVQIGILLFFSIFFILRFPIGGDIKVYEHYFELVGLNSMNLTRSPLFYGLMYVINYFDGNYSLFLVSINIINVYLIMYTIYHNSRNIFLSLFILITSGVSQIYMMNGLRQGIAMSVFFFAFFNLLMKRKYFLYILLSLISISFHETGFMCLFVLVIYLMVEKYNFLLSKKMLIIFALLSLAIFFAAPTIIEIIGQHLGHFTMYVDEWNVSIAGVGLRIVLLFSVSSIFFFSNKKEYTKEVFIYYLVTLLYLSFSGISVLSRICDFYAIIEIIVIPNMLLTYQKGLNKETDAIVLCVLMMYTGANYVMLADDINYMTNLLEMNRGIINYPYISILNYLN